MPSQMKETLTHVSWFSSFDENFRESRDSWWGRPESRVSTLQIWLLIKQSPSYKTANAVSYFQILQAFVTFMLQCATDICLACVYIHVCIYIYTHRYQLPTNQQRAWFLCTYSPQYRVLVWVCGCVYHSGSLSSHIVHACTQIPTHSSKDCSSFAEPSILYVCMNASFWYLSSTHIYAHTLKRMHWYGTPDFQDTLVWHPLTSTIYIYIYI